MSLTSRCRTPNPLPEVRFAVTQAIGYLDALADDA